MAVTKTARVIVAAGTSNAAGGSTTGTEVDLSTALGLAVTARVTNGGTAPTIGCTATVEVRESGSGPWRTWGAATGGLLASGVYDFAFDLPPPIMRARVSFSGNTGQAVTVEATGHELTTV
jgi:hypothetical protein